MTTPVVTVSLDATVGDIARLLFERRISAVPVIDARDRVLGIVSEGDLVRRTELGTEDARPWWLALLAGGAGAEDYLKTHGLRARQVMTTPAVTVDEGATIVEIAALLESQRIKRVPVVRDGRLVGIVSRANLLQALATHLSEPARGPVPASAPTREAVMQSMRDTGSSTPFVNVIVSGYTVDLWGAVETDPEREALVLAAERTPGVAYVNDHLAVLPLRFRGSIGIE